MRLADALVIYYQFFYYLLFYKYYLLYYSTIRQIIMGKRVSVFHVSVTNL